MFKSKQHKVSVSTMNITAQSIKNSKLLIAGGQIFPAATRLFYLSRDDISLAWHEITHAVNLIDLSVLVTISFIMVPLLTSCFDVDSEKKPIAYQIASHVSQAAKLAVVVYLFDCIVIALSSLGFHFVTLTNVSTGIAKLLYIMWIAQRVSAFKRYLLSKAISKHPEKLGRAATMDHLVDGLIMGMAGMFLLDVLDVDMGMGITSIFAFGSAGTLVIGLASQNLATMFVNGLVLQTSDRIAEGDHIKFGNGHAGRVKKIGWFQTTLKHYDELETIIPNSELGMERVQNLSRIGKCRVRQTLRFRYEDADAFDALLPDILDEIKKVVQK
eukprot:scaffold22996_cov59-Cyclotella_meneghiniana.AAC.1